jgi:PAS domain S-box-containing protein
MSADNRSRIRVWSEVRSYGLALFTCALALAIALPTEAASSCFFLAVTVSAIYGGRGAGILAVVLSALAFDYFFLSTQHHLTIEPIAYPRFVAFLLAAVLIVVLIEMKRRAEESRHQLHARYQAIADAAPDAIVSIDDNNRIQLINPAATKIFGWAEADLIGQPLTLLLPNFHVAERTTGAEWTGRRRDGTDFSAEVCFREVASGGRKHFTGFVRDVTDRRRSEAALQRSESYLAQAQTLSKTGSFGLNTSTGELFWSQETFRLVGLDPALRPSVELLFERIHPDDRVPVRDVLDRAFESGADLDFEHRFLMPDGSVKYVQVLARVVGGEPGNLQYLGAAMDITAQVRAEEALRASETNFRLIVDSIPGLVSMHNSAGEVELVNWQIRFYTGRTMEQLKDWRFVHPDDAAPTIKRWTRSVQTGEPFDTEVRLRRADGMYRWFHARALPLRNSNGGIVRWYTLLSDIEDRRQAQESVRVSEYNFRMIVDSIPGLVHTMTAAGEIELVSQQILDLSGRTLEELKDWPQFVHPDDRARVTSLVRRAIESGDPYDAELRIRLADGVYRWFQSRGVPLRDTEGRIVRWYCLLTDVEDRKTAEEALRASKRELSLIIETMPALVWCAAPNGELTYVNQRVLDYTGTTLDGLAKVGWIDYLHPDDVRPTVDAWSHAVATGQQHEIQYRLRRFDGAYRWFHVLGQLGRDSEGRMTRWYGLLIDMDERKKTEEALRSTQARLSRASQIAAVGELAASIAHEVNQPLSAVVANAHACLRWLLAKPPNLAKAHEAAERIVRDGKDAGEVVRRVRALFRRAAIERIPLDLNEVIAEVLRLLRGEAARKGVAVEIDLEENLPPVVADRIQLQQLLLNLLGNGLDAMDLVVDRPKKLSIRSQCNSPDAVQVEIRDYGVGLTNPDRVFEAFFTTKENGMGMGLAICRSIVEAHEGRLWASSEEVPGTTFSFTLPIKAPVEART